MAEMIRPEHRGKALGAVQSGWAIGWGAAVLLYTAAFSLLPPDMAWRVMFGIGLLPALLILYIRRNMQEPPRAALATGPRPSFLRTLFGVFAPETLRVTLIGGLFGLGAHGGFYGLFTWLPTYLKTERGLSVMGTGAYLAVIIVAFGVGCIVAGQLLDRLGRRRSVALFAVGCVAVTIAYLLLPIGGTAMLLLGFPLGFFAAGIPASMGALFNELYPAGVRGTGRGVLLQFRPHPRRRAAGADRGHERTHVARHRDRARCGLRLHAGAGRIAAAAGDPRQGARCRRGRAGARPDTDRLTLQKLEETMSYASPVPEIERMTMRQVTWRIIPFLMVCYFIAFVDRVNAGFAALQMNHDIGLTQAAFGLGGGLFYITYVLFEVPSNIAMEKVGARLWIARILITWGLVSAMMAFVVGPKSFYAVRLLLGASEAGFFPGVILYLTYWFPREYRGRIVAIFMVAIPVSVLPRLADLGGAAANRRLVRAARLASHVHPRGDPGGAAGHRGAVRAAERAPTRALAEARAAGVARPAARGGAVAAWPEGVPPHVALAGDDEQIRARGLADLCGRRRERASASPCGSRRSSNLLG